MSFASNRTPINANALAQLILRIDKASVDHRITPAEADTIAKRAKLVVMHSSDKAAASRAALDQFERLSSLRVDTLTGRAKDTLAISTRELARVTTRS